MGPGSITASGLSHDWASLSGITARSRCGAIEALKSRITGSDTVTCPSCARRDGMICAVPLYKLRPMDAFMIDLNGGEPVLGVLERCPQGRGYATVVYADPKGGKHREFEDRSGETVDFVGSGFRRVEWSAGTLVRPLMEDEAMSDEVNTSLVESGSPKPADIKAKVASLKAKAAAKIATGVAKGKPAGKVTGKPEAKVPKAPKEQKPCRCGCGGSTGGTFAPGHDARFYGWLKKVKSGDMEFKALPKHLQKEFGDVKGSNKFLAASGH